jgi:very-short-patch-repair endonuclease
VCMRHRKNYPYNPALKERARELRNNSTLSEVLLWNELKNGKMKGKDFHRQKPIMDYIVDFFCPELGMAIEIDGGSHDNENACRNDRERQKKIEELEIQFLRFNDVDVKRNMTGVLKVIEQWIDEHTPSLRDTPLKEGIN